MVSLEGIAREHVRMAAKEIDKDEVPSRRRSIRWNVEVDGKYYPPKYIICLANKFANGHELDSRETRTGKAQNYLVRMFQDGRKGLIGSSVHAERKR